MEKHVHRSFDRGFADHGWLKSFHSFSFASYHNPERMGFGLLRVLNDDVVAPGQGFDTHPHRDMEIVSIPLSGALRHKDSTGNEQVIRHGEVQIMSAGSGVAHSEYNASDEKDVNFLQIWVKPAKLGIPPRYDQKSFSEAGRASRFQTVVSPIGSGDEGVKINQSAYFSLLDLPQGAAASYQPKTIGSGLYIFVLRGEVAAAGETLATKDALGLVGVDTVDLVGKSAAGVVVIEVPMK